MAATLSFKDWLVQPGNHRLLQGFRQQLKSLLKKEVNITSWQDLYNTFEECLPQSGQTAKLFEPLLKQNPPSLENGASRRQIILYRRIYLDGQIAGTNTRETANEITYRGRSVATPTPVKDAPDKGSPEKNHNRPRYYRGVKID